MSGAQQPTVAEGTSIPPCPSKTTLDSDRCTYHNETPDSQTRGCCCSSEQIAEPEKEQQVPQEDAPNFTSIEVLPCTLDIPDGGVTAWLVVLGAWCVSFCSYGWINSIGTFQEYYQSGPLKEYSVSVISWIPSLQIFFMSFLGPVIGSIYDRYGLRLLMIWGSFLHVFGLMMASISSKYYQFMLSQGVCSAIGVAVIFLSAISAVTGWFHKRRGLAFGVLATGSSLGGVIFPILLNRLIDTVGYGWAMRTSAFMILALLIVANLTLKSRHAPTRRQLPQGHMWRPFRETPFVFLLLGLFLVPFGLYIPIDYIPVAAIGAGMRKDLAQNLIAFYNAASLVGRFSSGFISDRAGRFNIFIAACFISGILILSMWVPARTDAVAVAFSVLFGIFSGAYISLMAALVAQISPLNEVGYRNGLTFLFSSVGGLTTSPIAGAILQGPSGWAGLKVFAGVFMIAGTSFILAARFAKVGFALTTVF